MPGALVSIVTASDPSERNQSLDAWARNATLEDLLAACAELESFWRTEDNLYQRVRALFFLYALHRFHIPGRTGVASRCPLPFEAHVAVLERRFDEAIDQYLDIQQRQGPNEPTSSALAAAYREQGFQTLVDQVRRSVRNTRGNEWMFDLTDPSRHPHRVVDALLPGSDGHTPTLREETPVRMDLTHSGWSDIFFLGMDFPEGARVINTSIDLTVVGSREPPRPPIATYLRVLDQPKLRLVSVDLGAQVEIEDLAEVFDSARDHLGLLKAAVIASGVVPPGLENSDARLEDLLGALVGPGRGLELTSHVRGIPKGSRLAVSTNLLASLIALCMRATGQTRELVGPLTEEERRTVAARAILGEWLGGSGGGWQDSGGLWPGMKLIRGEVARAGDPEHGVSRGRLLPVHEPLTGVAVADGALEALCESLVLVHGGMAQDVGPVLEMVTERYLLRSEKEWLGRGRAMEVLDELLDALRAGDIRRIGSLTTENFRGPITTILPWATNAFTEALIERAQTHFGDAFWGFWMLGGCAGGGMGFLFAPERRDDGRSWLLEALPAAKAEFQRAVPFAMEPVVYDFEVNPHGSRAQWCEGPPGRAETLSDPTAREMAGASLETLLTDNGFDREQHEWIRGEVARGTLGLARNRLPPHTTIEDVRPGDVLSLTDASFRQQCEAIGDSALRAGEVAVVTLAGGSGTRWTQGAGVVKALDPFVRMNGRHRSFLEIHLAKSRRSAQRLGAELPHVFTTSPLTHTPMETWLTRDDGRRAGVIPSLSRGSTVGLRLVPTERDLRFAWEQQLQEVLDEQKQKVRESLHAALIRWARDAGEASDYTDNLPQLCLHPVGHWYEIPNLLLNGTLTSLLAERPGLRSLMLHNIDTLGADVDPALLGLHLSEEACLSFEVVPRQFEDRGGGLGRIDGRLRLIESLALPHEQDEWQLSWYNSLTTWIDIDRLLALFDLDRESLNDPPRIAHGVRNLAQRMPTYLTLKEVKQRWGRGQEDVFPVLQWERLWGDMTTLPEVDTRFFGVSRRRGQQLKEVAQLDSWLRDGSAPHVESLCEF